MTEKEFSISATPIEDADPVIQSVFSWSRAVYGTPSEKRLSPAAYPAAGQKEALLISTTWWTLHDAASRGGLLNKSLANSALAASLEQIKAT